MAKVKIYHPTLDKTAEVNSRAVRHYEKAGWKRAGESKAPKGARASRATRGSQESRSARDSGTNDSGGKSPASGEEK